MQGRKWLSVAALSATVLLLGGACREDTPPPTDGGTQAPPVTTLEEGVLTVGSDIPYPPFEFREGGELTGFDIDLINEIATRLGLEVEVVDTGFNTIFTKLGAGQFDVVIAASTITPEREEEVDFSDGYFNAQQSLTVQEGSDVGSVDDLADGDVVAVQSGTTGEIWAQENLEPNGVEIRAFPEGPDGYTALENGQVDGVVNDESTALAEVEARPGLELIETLDTGEVYGIAVNPDNDDLLDAVNEQLAAIIEDGTYDEIFDKYPELPPGGRVSA